MVHMFMRPWWRYACIPSILCTSSHCISISPFLSSIHSFILQPKAAIAVLEEHERDELRYLVTATSAKPELCNGPTTDPPANPPLNPPVASPADPFTSTET